MVVVDLETVPDMSRIGQAIIPKKTDESLSDKEWTTKYLSVTPEWCQIIGMGWKSKEGIQTVYVGKSIEGVVITEKLIIEKFWSLKREGLIGFNLIGFDIPVVCVRSAMLGILPKFHNPNQKPWDVLDVDIMMKRWPPRGWGAMSLDELSRAHSHLMTRKPEHIKNLGITGKDVYNLWVNNEFEKLERYMASDIWDTDFFYRLWGGLFF